jgi:putative Ca2+/H+ antiporter (TMEM165/GDT1 family)
LNLGDALKGALPEVFLDGLTAALFIIFATWILYISQLDFEILREFSAE